MKNKALYSILCGCLIVAGLKGVADVSYPAWWGIPAEASYEAVYEHGVPEADHAPVLIGQLKYLAAKGRDELNALLGPIGGAGSAINTMVGSFSQNDPSDQSPANLGQLKHITSKFYDRFAEIGFDAVSAGWPAGMALSGQTGYPWPENVTPENHATANIGQAKFLFAWDLNFWLSEEDAAGLGSGWKLEHFGTLDVDPEADPDGDGASNREEYLAGTDPNDYYDGSLPELVLISGDGQSVLVGDVAALPLTVQVQSGETLLNNAPVHFSVLAPEVGELASDGFSGLKSIDLRTDTNGRAAVDYAATGADVAAGNVTVRVSAHSNGMEVFADFTVTIIASDVQQRFFVGPDQSYLIDEDSVTAVGDDQFGQVSGATDLPGNIVKIVAGRDHVLALDATGVVYVWGDNFSGQLGMGHFIARNSPTGLDLGSESVLDIAAGDGFSALLVSDGAGASRVYLFGDLSEGLFDTVGLSPTFNLLPTFGSAAVVELSAAGRRILARCEDGSVWAWGDNRLGHADPASPAQVLSAPVEVIESGVIALDSSSDLSLALRNDGTLLAWGNSCFGQLGALNEAAVWVISVNNGSEISAFAAGNGFIAYVTSDGILFTAGLNDRGQLGRSTEGDIVSAPSAYGVDDTIIQLRAGDAHTLYLSDLDSLHGFGDASRGALDGVNPPSIQDQ